MLPTSRRRYPFKHHYSNVSGTGSGITETNPRVAIQRTTSETLRIERDLEVTNTNGCKVNEVPSSGSNIKKPTLFLGSSSLGQSSSFVVTNVSPRPDYVEASESPEPDSYSIETPSFSEDTQSYSRDLDDIVLVSSTNIVQSSSSVQIQDVGEAMHVEDLVIGCGVEDTEHSQRADGRYIGRFQVVKVESMGKFKRGRWHYQDYLDDSPHVPRDGYVFKDGGFIKNAENTNDRMPPAFVTNENASTHEGSIPNTTKTTEIYSNVQSE